MAVQARSDGKRVPGRRVYSNRGHRAPETPLETLLHVVALNVESRAQQQRYRPSDEDLREVVSALYHVGTGRFELEQILRMAAQRARSMTGATGAAVALQHGDSFVCRCSAGESTPPIGATFGSDSGISGECVRTAQVLSCSDTDLDARVNATVCCELGIRSLIVLPIFGRGTVIGVLEVFAGRPGAFRESDIYLLQLVSSLVAHALQTEASIGAAVLEEPVVTTASDVRLTRLPEVDTFAPAPLRLLAGVAASAILFLGAWFAITHNRGVAPRLDAGAGSAIATPAVSAQSTAVPALVTGIEFKSHNEFTAVKIRLSSPVRHTSGRLQNPERIYFDLFDTDMAAALGGQAYGTLVVNDAYVAKIRSLGSPGRSTRIVLDLKCACDYTAVLSTSAPYDLSILVQPPHGVHQRGSLGNVSFVPASLGTQRGIVGGLTIAIDPGHGGSDLGTTAADGWTEKELALDIARRLAAKLIGEAGVNVVLTRTDDSFVSLQERDRIAADAKANLLVSIHANSSGDPQARGVETFYYAPFDSQQHVAEGSLQPVSVDSAGSQTKELAASVQRELHSSLSHKDKSLRNRGVKKAQFALLVNAGMPAVLAEVGFMSSRLDEGALSRPEMRQLIADALFRGITAYIERKSKAASRTAGESL